MLSVVRFVVSISVNNSVYSIIQCTASNVMSLSSPPPPPPRNKQDSFTILKDSLTSFEKHPGNVLVNHSSSSSSLNFFVLFNFFSFFLEHIQQIEKYQFILLDEWRRFQHVPMFFFLFFFFFPRSFVLLSVFLFFQHPGSLSATISHFLFKNILRWVFKNNENHHNKLKQLQKKKILPLL